MRVNVSKGISKAVSTLAEASALVLDRWGKKPSTAFYRDPLAGIIEDGRGQPIAHVSYNGRVWSGIDRFGQSETKPTLLYDPSASNPAANDVTASN
jgi:hypothetical protein